MFDFGAARKMYQYAVHLILIFQALPGTRGVFFHERSYVTLAPGSSSSTFGFSLAYQHDIHTLVAGAPHSGLVGKVFSCPLDKVLESKNVACNEAIIDVDALAPYNKEFAPSLKLNLGYSVSAAKNYFLTCAPLWMGPSSEQALGTCFLYNDTAHRYKTYYETHIDTVVPKSVPIGNGWRTFIDDQWLIIPPVTPSDSGPPDVTYVNASNAQAPMTSVVIGEGNSTIPPKYRTDYRNFGFSLTAGKFFGEDTLYAISALSKQNSKGAIFFLGPPTHGDSRLKLLTSGSRDLMVIEEPKSTGTMFGAALGSARLNVDQREELLVGAPAWAQKDENGFEAGALHIYLGGIKDDIDVRRRHRMVLGNKNGARFGTAITASDLDGDGLSEIFVSAPYENGKGALYILSGRELHEKLIAGKSKRISVGQLKQTQRIHNDRFKSFGYSLQVIPDIDGNGCDELAVGSPESQNIMLLRCLPAVKVKLEAEYIGKKLQLRDKSFVIRVCVSVEDLKNRSLILPLTLNNEVVGNNVFIGNSQTKININVPGANNCTNVEVKLNDMEAGDYVFHTSVTMDVDRIINTDLFDTSWGLIREAPEARVEVSRRCSGADCDPKFEMDLSWSGGNISNGSYDLGSSKQLSAEVHITNVGNASWEACAMIKIMGANVAQIGCDEDAGQYKCLLPIGLMRNANHTIEIKLDMSQPTNINNNIHLSVILYDFCDKPVNVIEKNRRLLLNYDTNDVILNGSYHDLHLTDTKIQDQLNSKEFKDAHEYWIENKGTITWINVTAVVEVYKKTFFNLVRVMDWPHQDLPDKILFSQKVNLPPGSKEKIIVAYDIMKNKIMENLKDDRLIVQTKFTLYLLPHSKKEKSLSSTIIFKREMRLGQNKGLIIALAILGAGIILALIIFVLYKMQFFKSAEKERLQQLQNHIKNNGGASQLPDMSACNEAVDELEMEVEDDAFEIIDVTTPVLENDKKEGT